jgi:hypothetical protein
MIDKETVVPPGHGTATDRDGLVAFRDMLRTVEDRIRTLVEAQRGASDFPASTT